MTAQLLLVDPQNDFCDIAGATLPVPGADADLRRVAALVETAGSRLSDIVVTLDSHAVYGIERPAFWKRGGHSVATDDASDAVSPFTAITAQSVRDGAYAPRDPSLQATVLAYLNALEASPKKYTLMVWPTHCVTGTWGHNLHGALAEALGRWEASSCRTVEKVLKGLNPLTEQYSAVRAEVPVDGDPRTQTNHALVRRIVDFPGVTFIAGEASSHCVAATADDLFAEMDAERRSRVVLLSDGMSPVGGFEAGEQAFLSRAEALGVRRMTVADATAWLMRQ